MHALGISRAKESLFPYQVFLRLQVDDEQLCDTPLWDGDLPSGSVGPSLPVGPQRDGDTRQPLPSMGGCVRDGLKSQKRSALTERRQGSKLRFPNGFDKETKTPVTCKQ